MRAALHAFLFVASLTLCALIASSPTYAQAAKRQPPAATPSPAPQDQDETKLTVTTREVRLPITVLDKKEQPVAGLTANDFLIYEDKQPQKIESFTDERQSLPIYVAVLMDTSSSTAGKLQFEREAAKDFIYTVARVRKDKIAFATFDDDVNLLQDFTDRLNLLDKAIDGVKKPGTQTSLYDAVWQFCDQKLRGAPGRRVIVVITDGDDTYSRATLRDAIDLAQRTETLVFAISTKAGFSGAVPGVEAGTVADKGDRDLIKLCEETGGKAFFTGDQLALERSFTKVARELRGQYILTYRPTNTNYDGGERRIEVRLADSHGGLKIRTRRGYRAVKETKETVNRE